MLLVHERSTVRDMSLPSKLTSYFAAGRPVVAMVRRDSATAAELERSGAGMVVDHTHPADLAVALNELQSNPSLRRRLGSAALNHVNRYPHPSSPLNAIAQLCAAAILDSRTKIPAIPHTR